MASPAVSFARENQKRFLEELKDLLRIPSVSTLEEHKGDIEKAAKFVANELERIGCMPAVSQRRFVTRIMTCSRRIRWMNGRRLRLSRPSATRIFMRAARWTTKASSGCR